MSLKSVRKKIDDGVYLNIINTDKFKSSLISIYFIRPLDRQEVTMNALVPLILKRGTNRYKKSIEIEKKLEELYGSSLSVNVNKKGERHIIRFTLEGPSYSYIEDKDIFEKKIKIMNEIINNPLLEDGLFVDDYINSEKINLEKRIKSRINNKKQYSINRCIEEMCKDERYSLYRLGYLEDLKNIDNEQLYNHYKKVIETSPIEVFISGNLAPESVIEKFKSNFKIVRHKVNTIKREKVLKSINEINRIEEEMNVNQGKLILGYRTNIPYEDKLYEPLLIASNILGGGPNSKLFINVREKNSLAYYIYTKTYKYKSLLMISSGIEFDKYEKTLEIIKQQVEELKKGNFKCNDISDSQKSLITSIKIIEDSNYSISEYYLSNILTNEDKDVDELINLIKSVKREQIIQAAEKIELDTIYFLKNVNN